MKRREFLRHLAEQGCSLLREGGKYSIFENPVNKKTSPVTRHNELGGYAVRKICRDLDIQEPGR